MKVIGIVLGVFMVVVISAVVFLNQNNQQNTEQNKNSEVVNNQAIDENMGSNNLSQSQNDQSPAGETQQGSGKYIAYSDTELTNMKNVIFFAASWCPTCRYLDRAINENLTNIPSDLTILKADYDAETALKQKYGVTYQHTLVQVDQDGNQINKWNGGYSIEDIVKNII